ncbi:MAG: transporter permease [Clostridia bacterium]|nr:transporter permease [Clostridia bacterium]
MKRNLWIYLGLFILAQMLKALITTAFLQEYGEGRVEVKMKVETALDFAIFQSSGIYKELQPAIYNKSDYQIEGKVKTDILGIGTNHYYKDVENVRLMNGAFYGEQAVKEGRNVVVISDQLAIKLFGSEKATGNSCDIGDAKYQVIGVYKKFQDLWHIFLDDGRERVYFPITSQAAKRPMVEVLLIEVQDQAGSSLTWQLKEAQIDSENSFIYHAGDAAKRLKSLKQLPISILALFLTIYISKVIFSVVKEKGISLKHKIILMSICGIGGYLMMRMGIKPIYISREALPPYNIFDISFYIKHLRERHVIYYYFLELNLSHYQKIYRYIGHLLWLLNIGQVICYFKIKSLYK